MIGKNQKFSRGRHASGFVPDYPHCVDVAGESEGFGSCGRVDSDGDSCAPNRRSINLNKERFDVLRVPSQVISFSKMSFSERRELEERLRMELEQIRTFQKKVFVNFSEAVASSSTNMHRQQKKKKLNNKQLTDTPVPQRAKCGIPNRTVAAKNDSSNPMAMKRCGLLLDKLMSHKYSQLFNTPVDVVRWNIPDYFTIIKHPMDLGTIKSKLNSGAYLSPWEFSSDVRLTFSNAMTYNPPKNDVHRMARTLSRVFEGSWKSIEKNFSTMAHESVITRENGGAKTAQRANIGKIPPKVASFAPSKDVVAPIKRITDEDRQNLSTRLMSLVEELPVHIIDFLRRHTSDQTNEDEIELDIETLGDDTLYELQSLLDKHFKDRKMPDDACPKEAIHDVISSSSVPACKENDSPDEDVDIGGNEDPLPCYPPVEIEKDAVGRNNGCSSSSSDSVSSSSDSDSTSSSESEREREKTSPAARIMEKTGPQAEMNQYKSDAMNLDENCLPHLSVQPQQNSHTDALCLRENGQQMGENATSERQVSPEKRYQNALKVNRFAETILRAREKTLDKAGKGDREKLQREKEEFTKLQIQEKARLQAEAKMAEEAQRREQATAAAEAKRQREKDREAARQALLQMEKTVEIDENSMFLKDLEMLRRDAVEQVPSSVDETSPDLCPDGIGSFRLGGSNPLEKLGLFMKVDDEDEEDLEPSHPLVKNVEEGEIC